MLSIAMVLLILWLLGYFAFHVGSGLIHVLLAASVIVLVIGLLRRRG
jgi:hypothetical protein